METGPCSGPPPPDVPDPSSLSGTTPSPREVSTGSAVVDGDPSRGLERGAHPTSSHLNNQGGPDPDLPGGRSLESPWVERNTDPYPGSLVRDGSQKFVFSQTGVTNFGRGYWSSQGKGPVLDTGAVRGRSDPSPRQNLESLVDSTPQTRLLVSRRRLHSTPSVQSDSPRQRRSSTPVGRPPPWTCHGPDN